MGKCINCERWNVWDRVLYLDADGELTTYPARVTCVESKRCLTCRRDQPLGESNDADPAVQVEIRAAEIAAWETRYGATRSMSDGANFTEQRGWLGEKKIEKLMVRDEHGGLRVDLDVPLNLDSPSWSAGYLARVIHDHDTQHPASTGGDGEP